MILQLSVFLLAFFYLDKTQAGTPSIDNCPGTIFRRVSSPDATVSATWDEPNCGTNSHSTHLPGSEFGPGVHHVIYWFASSMDRSNTNERCCSFDIVVSGPDFDLCSQNVCKGGEVCVPEVDRYYCYPGGTNIKIRNCSKTVIIRKTDVDSVTAQWVEPTAFDHYGQLLQPFGMPQFLPGSSLALGEHAITYTFRDREQEATCSFRVIAAENTGPGFQNCPQDITVVSSESAVRVYWLEPILQTNEDRNQVSFTQTHNPGQLFTVPSETTVTYTFRDRGTSKSNECSFLVSTVLPVSMNGVVLPSTGKFVRRLQGNPGQSPEAWPRPYYYRFDSTHTTPLIVIPSRIQADIRLGSTSNHIYPKGFYPVMYNFTDVDGNLLTTSDFIIVYYNNDPDSAPILRDCSGNTRIEVLSEVPSRASWSVPHVEGNEENLVWTEKPQLTPNQDILPLGETVLDYLFYSPNFEEPLQCRYTVSITDRMPPQFLYCPGEITKTVRSETGLLVDFPRYLIAQDGPDGMLSSVFASQQPPVFLRAGQSQVITYTAADIYDNRATCEFTVSVLLEDSSPVEITNCLNRTHVTSVDVFQLEMSEYPVAVRDSGVIIARATLNSTSFTVNKETSVSATFPSLTVNFVTDESCVFTVLVLDDNPPVINNCSQEVVVPAIKCEKVVRVSWTEPTSVNSLEGGALVTRTHTPLDPFPVGETTVVWYMFEDRGGLQTHCSINITVGKARFEDCQKESFDGEDNSEPFSFETETIVVIVVTAVATFVFSLAIFLLSLCCCTCCCVVDTAKTNTNNDSHSNDNQRTRLFVKIGGTNFPIYGPVTPLSTNKDVSTGRQIDDGESDYGSETDQPSSSRAYQNEAPKLPSVSESVFGNAPSNVATGNNYIEQNGGREHDSYGYDFAIGDGGFPPPRPPKPGKQENPSKMVRKKTFLEMQAAVQTIREEQAWKGRVVDDGDVYGFDQPAN